MIRFPFLGTRVDGDPFQYLLLSMEGDRTEIAIYDWFVNKERLELEESIHLHIPNTNGILGKVDSFSSCGTAKCVTYTIIQETTIGPAPVAVSGQKDDLIQLIKDSFLLKCGVKIYMTHLGAYFSRITDYSPKAYSNFKSLLFPDIEKKIKENVEQLRELHGKLLNNVEEILAIINLDELREVMESEINLTLFDIFFTESKLAPHSGLKEVIKCKDKGLYSLYLNSIKNLERRLYSNYNLIVLIYSTLITPSTQV